MNISFEEKINMSLDDLMKTKKNLNKKKPAATADTAVSRTKPQASKNSNAGSSPTNPKTKNVLKNKKKPVVFGLGSKNIKIGKNLKNASTHKEEIQQQNKMKAAKVSESVGTAKANRNAAINQKRGLNNTGKATKSEVKSAVKNVVAKSLPKAKAPAVKSGVFNNNTKQQVRNPVLTTTATKVVPSTASLKISFNPKQLRETTDADVARQIKGVLSKEKAANVKGVPAVADVVNALQSRKVAIGAPPSSRK